MKMQTDVGTQSGDVKGFLARGNEAICWGAISAGCRHFFGYPITPQNEVTEWFARELPARGGRFVQADSEWSGAAMLFGCAACGVRVMTSTSSPGWGLMQEVLSNIAGAMLPCVVVDVQRGGPGQGSVQHAQMDYLSATRCGHGGYKNIVLAPNSVQETCDLVQLSFHLADKYRNLTVVLSDGIVGLMVEPLVVKTLDFGPLPEKKWALRGLAKKDGKFDWILSGYGAVGGYGEYLKGLVDKYEEIKRTEVRYESYRSEDADLVLVAFGYVSRVCREAVDMARAEGLRVGLIRPITLWPFPYEAIRKKADERTKFLVVEDNLGGMIEDVIIGAAGRSEVHGINMLDRHVPTAAGMILPDKVCEKARQLLGKECSHA